MVLSRTNYSIGDAAEICGVSAKQLRQWEEKGFIPAAERVRCGDRSYRYYDYRLIDIIRRIKAYLDQGYTLKTAAQKAAADDRRGN